jgi:magnesium transporter
MTTISVADRARVREAIDNARRVPREFVLFLPSEESNQRTLRTTSLNLIVTQLQIAIRKSAKLGKDKSEQPRPPRPPIPPLLNVQPPTPPTSSSDLKRLGNGKGKQRQALRPSVGIGDLGPTKVLPLGVSPKAWWLDIASPTWDDMRKLGQVRKFIALTGLA